MRRPVRDRCRAQNVPIMIGAVRARIELNNSGRIGAGGMFKQQELDPTGLPRKDAEIHAVGKDGGTQREAPTGLIDHRLSGECRLCSPELVRAGRNDPGANRRAKMCSGHETISRIEVSDGTKTHNAPFEQHRRYPQLPFNPRGIARSALTSVREER